MSKIKNTKKRINLRDWFKENDKVKLIYEDNSIVYIKESDFDRAFGTIVSLSKEDVIRDFAIDIT